MITETSAGITIRTGPGVEEPSKRPPGCPAVLNLDKALKIRHQSQAIGEFLDWCHQKGWHLCVYHKGCEFPRPIRESNIQRILAEYFGIDYDAMNKEQEAVLEYMRKHP